MHKKGQAAMEFLMTYGWAILAAIIAIGVLAYFGIFSPGRFVSDNYVVNAPFNVRAGSASATSGIQLELLNGAGDLVQVSAINIDNCGNAVADPTLPFNQPTGNVTLYTVTCAPVLISGDTFRGDISITYTKSGTTLPLQSTGSITAQVA